MDDVKGVIVGGDYVSWHVFYENRSQTPKMYAANYDEAKEQAQAVIDKLKEVYKGYPCYLYPDDSKWAIVIK